MQKREFEFLKQVLETPSAPFREQAISSKIQSKLKSAKIPFFLDAVGNLIAGVASMKELQSEIKKETQQCMSLFIAHMDHPGFHLTNPMKGRKDEFRFNWHGGGPTKKVRGSRVWVSDQDGNLFYGKILSTVWNRTRTNLKKGTLRLDSTPELPLKGAYGGLHFDDFIWQRGNRIYTKAADDLVGCFCIAEAFATSWHKNNRYLKIALFSVAEEVGWVGAIAHFRSNIWKHANRPVYAISIETSRAMPKAEIGQGPVIRYGDKVSIFDAQLSQEILCVASEVCSKYQWRVMDGGTCEGSVSAAWDLKTAALSIPLGNYHNQSLEGGERAHKVKMGPAPEFIDQRDLQDALRLTKALVEKPLGQSTWKTFSKKRQYFLSVLNEYQSEIQIKKKIESQRKGQRRDDH